jgi:hypothetical protein
MMNWVSLLPLMRTSFFFELCVRFFWAAVLLAPITVAVALLRVRLDYAALTVLTYQIIMNGVVFAHAPKNLSMFGSLAVAVPLNFAVQVPVWWLTRLLARRLTFENRVNPRPGRIAAP